MKAVVLRGAGAISIETVDDPTPAAHEVVVGVRANGLCGSDLHMVDGELSWVTYPLIPGHEFAGDIVAVGTEVDQSWIGQRVAVDPMIRCGTCDHCGNGRINLCRTPASYGVTRPGGSASFCAVSESNLVPLPEGLSFEAAAISQPLACAVHALRRAALADDDGVLVVGAGATGLLLAQAARALGAATVAVCEPLEMRRGVARELGFDHVFEGLEHAGGSRGYSLVVDATGNAAVLPKCLDLVDSGGTVLVFGISRRGEVAPIEPVVLYEREITIVGSRGLNGTHAAAVEMLATGSVAWEPLATDRHSLEDLPAALERLRRGGGIKSITVSKL